MRSARPLKRGAETLPPIARSVVQRLSIPSPRTIKSPPATLRSSVHGVRSASSITSSASRPMWRTARRGTADAALALPSVKRPRSSLSCPDIRPPRPSERIVSGPVTVAAISSRSSNCALTTLNLRSSCGRPPEKSTDPAPAIVPPAGVLPPIWSSTRRDPPKRPLALRFCTTMPVTALSIRALTARIEPRICGSTIRPLMSAPIATGPDKSIISTPDRRQSVSAGPA